MNFSSSGYAAMCAIVTRVKRVRKIKNQAQKYEIHKLTNKWPNLLQCITLGNKEILFFEYIYILRITDYFKNTCMYNGFILLTFWNVFCAITIRINAYLWYNCIYTRYWDIQATVLVTKNFLPKLSHSFSFSLKLDSTNFMESEIFGGFVWMYKGPHINSLLMWGWYSLRLFSRW